MNKRISGFVIGLFCGAILFGGSVAYAAGIAATPIWQKIYFNGEQTQMMAYNINGNNYVKLRDIGQAVGFNVYWGDGVQIDTSMPYTGEAPMGPVDEVLTIEEIRNEMAALINEVRAKNGVELLTVDPDLMAAAQDCADWKAKSHDTIAECKTVAGCGYPHGFGSNLTAFTGAAPSEVAERAVQNWINSPGHFQNIITANGEHLGVGVVLDGRWTYCYMLVGQPDSSNPYV